MHTFVLRVRGGSRRDPDPGRLRGVVDDVTTGERSTFTSDAELLRVLHAAADATAESPGNGSVETDSIGREN